MLFTIYEQKAKERAEDFLKFDEKTYKTQTKEESVSDVSDVKADILEVVTKQTPKRPMGTFVG